MASSFIHYAISKKILEDITVESKARFLFGASMVPDASSHDDGSYNKAHYAETLTDRSLKGINWNYFYDEYQDDFWKDDLYLGYYCHLIQDAVWFHDIVDKYIRIYPKEKQTQMYQKGYRDYNRLNYLLARQYGVEPLKEIDIPSQIRGINTEKLKELCSLFSQWTDSPECNPSDLELYTWDIISEYIEKCTRICIFQIRALKKGADLINPVDYYVVPLLNSCLEVT